MALITKTNPAIKQMHSHIKAKLLSNSGLKTVERNEWIDSGRFNQGMFGQRCLVSYLGGGFDENHPMTEMGIHVYASVWSIDIPLLAGKDNELNDTLRNAVGGVFDTLLELTKGDSASKLVGCDEIQSFSHSVEEQEPIEDRLVQSWCILSFPNVTLFSEGLV
tara:strand:- start:3805 stop:4293 length:489 start_codon:yes stop_codon:yes gene_type:complete